MNKLFISLLAAGGLMTSSAVYAAEGACNGNLPWHRIVCPGVEEQKGKLDEYKAPEAFYTNTISGQSSSDSSDSGSPYGGSSLGVEDNYQESSGGVWD